MEDELWSIELGKGIGPLQLGATRDDVLRILDEAGLEYETDDENPQWLYVDQYDADLTFTTHDPPTLQEICVVDERVRLGPAAVIDQPLHQVVDFLQVPDNETLWQLSEHDGPLAPLGKRPDPPADDSELLDGGTLWIPALGLGLGMLLGEIASVHLRLPHDVPQEGLGPLTDTQRGLSRLPDLASHLLRPGSASTGQRWYRRLLTLAFVAGIAVLMWQAVRYQQRWNQAPTVEGEVIAMRPPPPDPFPTEFTVAYHDRQGRRHEVVLDRADVYVVEKLGDKVQLHYLPEAPEKPMGPARVRDAAFVKFMPWAIGWLAAYLIAQLIGNIVPVLWGKS